ncbi:MAG: 50S ribosomal protein L2 [Alphaproteobacteria bacterium]
MALKQFRPMTPAQRGLVLVDRSELHKGRPEKTLTVGLTKKAGRNHHGRITLRRRGGGHKRLYRIVDFKRRKFDVAATVERLEYDPNRSAFIALLTYEDGEKAYILAPQRLAVGDSVIAGNRVDVKPGNAMPLNSIPVGTIVHNVEMKGGKGGQIARSAGTYVQLVGRDQGYAILRLGSGEQRMVRGECMATVGAVSNPDHGNIKIGKAGRSRWLGKRPSVRGVAMNPVDHPHGGGEGRTSGGRHPVTPWGKPTKGKRTRGKKASSKLIIRRRRR